MITNLINNTINNSWPLIVMLIVTLIIFRFLYYKNSRTKLHLYKELMNLLFLIYLLLLFTFLSSSDLNATHGFNIYPLKEIMRYEIFSDLFILNIIGNIIAFTPLGFYVGYYVKKKKIKTAVMTSFLISSMVEGLQYFIGRSFDIDDIILNVFGALAGVIVYMILKKIKSMLPSFLQKDGLYTVLCLIIVLLLVLYSLNTLGVISLL